MTFPSLPTDNLYKFLALAGTVVVILSIYSAETRVAELEDRNIDNQEAKDIATARYQSLQTKVELVKKIIANSIADQMGNRKKDASKLEIHYSEAEIKELERQVQDLLVEQDIEIVKAMTSTKRFVQLAERAKEILHWSFLFVTIGAAMAYAGFILWYRRVQKPLDVILRKELTTPMQSNPPLNDDAGEKAPARVN